MTEVLNWSGAQPGSLPAETVWLFGMALLVSAVGFYRRVYFISIGYAFSMVGMAILALVLLRDRISWLAGLHPLGLAMYGLRLGSYLLKREARPAYQTAASRARPDAGRPDRKLDVLIWLGVSALYLFMFAPALFNLADAATVTAPAAVASQAIGLITMVGGLLLETFADKQKSDFKAHSPTRYCDVALYRWVRCPNYLGEIIFWTGSWLMGLAFYTSLLRWVISLAGLICIVLIMMGSTKRLEASQLARYGGLPDYQAYIRRVPVLFPFVPVYSLQNIRVYLK